jgi:hypothetical protein
MDICAWTIRIHPLWRPFGVVEMPSGATKRGAKASHDLRDSSLDNEASELDGTLH